MNGTILNLKKKKEFADFNLELFIARQNAIGHSNYLQERHL